MRSDGWFRVQDRASETLHDQIIEKTKEYPVSFNGKMRFTLHLSLDLGVEEIKEIVMKEARTSDQLKGAVPKKIIVVPGKIINIVV